MIAHGKEIKVFTANSNVPFARGICGEAAAYFDPLSPRSIGEAICALADDAERRRNLVAAGTGQLEKFLSSEARTERYLRILEAEFAGGGDLTTAGSDGTL